MHKALLLLIISVFGIFVSSGDAQDTNEYSVNQISDHIYELSYQATGYTVKVIASVGPDGILLVDTGHKPKAEALKAKLEELWHGTPKVIILTHEHIEHIGGNEIFGSAPLVIGHTNLRKRLTSGYFLFDEYTDATLPEIEFSDSLSLYFNGEKIRLISVAGGHTGSDIIVWFTKSNIACVAALCNWPHFPSIDGETGSITKYPEAVKRAIDILPSDIKVVPGHGDDCTMVEMKKFYDMLVKTRDIVSAELAKGKNVETMQKEEILKDFKSYEGSYTSANDWIALNAMGIQNIPLVDTTVKSVFDPVYHSWKAKGIDSAITEYKNIKENHAKEYAIDESVPTTIGYLFYQNKKYPEAIKFFELSLNVYPKGSSVSDNYRFLGKIYEKMNDYEQAVKSYKNYMKLNPKDSVMKKTVKELEKK